MSNLGGRNRFGPCLDTVDEVLAMISTRLQMEFVRPDYRTEPPRRICFDLGAANEDPAFVADKLYARVARLAGHHNAVGVPISNVVFLDGIVKCFQELLLLGFTQYFYFT